MKRVLNFILCFVLVFAGMGTGTTRKVLADGEEIDPNGIFELTAKTGNYNVGDAVEVRIYVHDYALGSFDFLLEYDKNIFNQLTEDEIVYNNTTESGDTLQWYTMGYLLDDAVYNGVTCDNVQMMEESSTVGAFSQGGYFASLFFEVKADFSETTINIWDAYLVTQDYHEYSFENISCIIGNTGDTNSDVAFSVAEIEAVSGKEAELPLNIISNSGFNALGITISYDNTICSYNDILIEDAYKDKIDLQSVYEVPGEGKVKASFIAVEDITDIGQFATLLFTVKGGYCCYFDL